MTAVRFEGGRRTLRLAAIVAIVALALTLVLGLLDAQRALEAYHVAVVYWAGIAVGALLINMAFQAGKAKWYVVTRRYLETIPLSLVLFVVLFIPVLLGMRRLFPWVDPSGLEEELKKLAEHRHGYLNTGFFVVRFVLYFALWIGVAHLLHGWSTRQDEERGVRLTELQRRLCAGALPFVALAMSFAAFDWQMSLDLHLASTIFGLYYFAGSFLSAFAVLILMMNGLRAEPGSPGALANPNHYHALGKWLLAFVSFWAYMAFSQYLLIWIANLPEEVPWYVVRNRGGWAVLGGFLVVFHFVVPFFALLSRPLKRSPRALGFVAVYVLVVHYVDVYWVMMPALERDAPSPRPHLADLTALVGVGGAALAFVLWRLHGRPAVPVGDPYLD
ncbi:MAG: hypothetical protein ACJ79E_21810, partial [Anaeromyxobacteraceae bacterium]